MSVWWSSLKTAGSWWAVGEPGPGRAWHSHSGCSVQLWQQPNPALPQNFWLPYTSSMPHAEPLPPSMWPQRGWWGRAPAQQPLVHNLCTSEALEELARPCGASQTSVHPWCCKGKQMAGLWQTTLSNLPGGSGRTLGGQCKLCCMSQPQEKGNGPRLHSWSFSGATAECRQCKGAAQLQAKWARRVTLEKQERQENEKGWTIHHTCPPPYTYIHPSEQKRGFREQIPGTQTLEDDCMNPVFWVCVLLNSIQSLEPLIWPL